MKIADVICALALLATTPMSQAARQRWIKVGVNELLRHPAKYNGKQVSVTGYLATSCEWCLQIFEDEHRGKTSDLRDSVRLGNRAQNSHIEEIPQGFDGYVHVTGTFQYVERRHGHYNGFGFMGMWQSQITRITAFKIISHKIPIGGW